MNLSTYTTYQHTFLDLFPVKSLDGQCITKTVVLLIRCSLMLCLYLREMIADGPMEHP